MVAVCLSISLLGIPTKVEAIPPIYEPPQVKVYAFEQILNKWGSEQWDAFDKLIKRESQWNSDAQNPNSSAYGYGQFLNSTWSSVGCEKTIDPYEQIDCTIKYVEQRYGTPQKALQFHYSKNYY